MIFGLNLKNKVDRLKLFIILGGFILFAVIMSFSVMKVTSSSSFCSACHVMKPQTVTWQASAHSRISCTDCHIEPGFKNGIEQRVEGVKNVYAFFTGEYTLPTRMAIPISDNACLKCHQLEREVSPTGDLVIPHQTHNNKKVSCVRCHSGVAHGNIANQRATITGDIGSWDLKKGIAQMAAQNTKTPMDNCMKCHGRRNAPLECSACHTADKKPESHITDDFLTLHGKQAISNIDNCTLCHGYSGYVDENKKLKSKTGGLTSEKLLLPGLERPAEEVVNYTRNNKFCISCHSQKPKSHESPSFGDNHVTQAKTSSTACFTCHSNRTEDLNVVTKTSCGSCHPSTHSRGTYKYKHPVPINGKIEQSCFSCHTANNCSTCHTSMRPKIQYNENLLLESFENNNFFDFGQ